MKSVSYTTYNKLNCGCNAEVIICVDEALTATGAPYIEGTIAFSDSVNDACGRAKYRYALTYDEGQLLDPNYSLLEADIMGVVCRGCLTNYIDYNLQDNDWHVIGNAATIDGVNFCGTTDNIAFDVRVNNLRARRTIPDPISPVIIDGYYQNEITPETQSGSAILSGGAIDINYWWYDANKILNDPLEEETPFFNVICGGAANLIENGREDFIGCGEINSISNTALSTIVNGWENVIDGDHYSFVCGGAGAELTGGIHNFLGDTSGGAHILNCGSSAIIVGQSQMLFDADMSVIVAGEQNVLGKYPFTQYGQVMFDAILNGHDCEIRYTSYSSIVNGIYNRIVNPELPFTLYHIENSGNSILGGYTNSVVGYLSSVLGGIGLKIGAASVGYQAGGIPATFNDVKAYAQTDVTAFPSIAYFGDVDLWVGNVTSAAKKIKWFEPNASKTYTGTHYSSIEAQAQADNIEYKLPAAAGVAGQVLKIQSVVGTVVTLEWANDLT